MLREGEWFVFEFVIDFGNSCVEFFECAGDFLVGEVFWFKAFFAVSRNIEEPRLGFFGEDDFSGTIFVAGLDEDV